MQDRTKTYPKHNEESKQFHSLNHRMGHGLRTNPVYKIGEIAVLFLAAIALIAWLMPLTEGDPILRQLGIWSANMLMLFIVWGGMKLRGERPKDLGLDINPVSWREAIKTLLISLLVFVIAVAAFVIGSIVMANITGVPEQADMSGYDYLKDNIGMLLLTLAGVYIVSSFGEEVIYRGFLINRISQLGSNTRTARIVAVILSSIIFGLVHFQWGPMGVVQTGFMGLALGICYIKLRKRFWAIILAHAYMDTILMVQMYMASN